MCNRKLTTLEEIIHKLHDGKEERDTALSHQIRNNSIINNVCGAMHKLPGLFKWPAHWVGNYYFRPCRTKGVHPGKKDEPIVCQIHHINGDCCDDRPENHVRLCLLCHVEMELLLRRQHNPNVKQFRDWFRTESYTNSKGFNKIAKLGNLPAHIPPNPTTFYSFRNEWEKYGGWEYIIPKKYYKLSIRTGTKPRAMRPNFKSWTAHIKLMKEYKIKNKKEWNKLITKLGGPSTGYLTADAFARIYKKEWLKFGRHKTKKGTIIIRFHYLGKNADWSHAANPKSYKRKAKELQAAIRKLIKTENKSNPYTDEQIRKKLKRKNVEVIRIHRNKAGIKNFRERKKKYGKRQRQRN